MNEQRLEVVLRVRSLRERIARSEVAQRRLELHRRQADEAAAWTALRERTSVGRLEARPFVAHRGMLGAGVGDARAAGRQVAAADRDVDVSMAAWQDEARRLDGIERLAERVRAEASAERDRAERTEIDDLVVMRADRAAEPGAAR